MQTEYVDDCKRVTPKWDVRIREIKTRKVEKMNHLNDIVTDYRYSKY